MGWPTSGDYGVFRTSFSRRRPSARTAVSRSESGGDGTVRLWEVSTGTCLRTLQAARRYERLDITGLTGVTSAQRAALLALGAVEQSS